ncbi:hypothetical protein MLD52_10815 [Puniceicoccaceae bacterium K14]|nr:hypothetical protein [Puniceicoccaceae bacterium K14]
MKNPLQLIHRLLRASVVLALLATCSFTYAQSDTETKIKLMSEALQARDDGDLETSRTRLEELLKIVPNDASVKRILQDVETMIAEKKRRPNSDPVSQDTPERRAALLNEAKYMAELEAERIDKSMSDAREIRDVALRQAKRGDYDTALINIEKALNTVELNPLTKTLVDELKRDQREIMRDKSQYGASSTSTASSGKKGRGKNAKLPIDQISPDYVSLQEEISALELRARSQFFAGDIDGAEATFKQIEVLDPNNDKAKSFLIRISRERESMAFLNKLKTREQLLEEVSSAWQRPGIYEERPDLSPTVMGPAPLQQKLNNIIIPTVNFTNVDLTRVVNTLSAISEEFDNTDVGTRGVNLVLIDPDRTNPLVNITLRNLSIKRILDFIVDSVGFQYEVQQDAVVLRPGGERRNLNTEVFPVSRSTVIRMTGLSGSGQSDYENDPFANGATSPARGFADDANTIRTFLQQAGVDFTGVEGSTMAYDGSAMIVTQSSRNLERIRNILNRYTDVKQVEIEAKFLEVEEGALDELGFDWFVSEDGALGGDGVATGDDEIYQSSMRTLADTAPQALSGAIVITNEDGGKIESPLTAPSLPGGLQLGVGTNPFTEVFGRIDDVALNVTIRALSQKSGSDLLSAPKVTVLSGNQAEISVGQEFRYPTSYSDTESNVGSSSENTSGAGVTITPGTPEDFETRNVGVELSVTPIVEEDDYSITLEMNPKVTEFEGFVEYGGASVAIAGGRTVTAPSGFYQPIFSVREVSTKVTIWDGATVVMGGLTREEVVTVSDKVPFLGDIPLFGRFFRSEGESSAKRNLLIFVTANLVSPGGSPKRQTLRGVSPGSMFQNPTIVTPGGSESRSQ